MYKLTVQQLIFTTQSLSSFCYCEEYPSGFIFKSRFADLHAHAHTIKRKSINQIKSLVRLNLHQTNNSN